MTDKPLLILVDDDEVFLQMLEKAMLKRGFDTLTASSKATMLEVCQSCERTPSMAVLDLKLEEGSGLELIPLLKARNSEITIVMLTGYASIATAVSAIKLGASNYLSKPVNADEVVAALLSEDADLSEMVPNSPMSVNRVEWEHIQKVLKENNQNISATARSLRMHRRTLQRKLGKKPSAR